MPASTLLAQRVAGGVTFAEVVANGSGCPAGTTHTAIGSDGLTFTTLFDSFVSQVTPQQTIDLKDCVLSIKLHSPFGRAFAIQTFSYRGQASLGDGLIGRQTATYNFQGRPLPPADSNRLELVGPYNDNYLFVDEIGVLDRVWSPCGFERDLNVTVRMQVQNPPDRPGTGSMSLSSLNGTSELRIGLVERDCDVGAIPVEPPPFDAGAPAPDADPRPEAGVPADAGAPRDAQAPRADAATPVTPGVPKPTEVRLRPSVIRRDQPFIIDWTASSAAATTTFVAEVRTPPERGDEIVWRSLRTPAAPIAYDGPSFPAPGLYRVVVIAQGPGGASVVSDPASLSVRTDGFDALPSDAGALPPAPRPDAGPPVSADAGANPRPDAGPPPVDAGAVDAGSAETPLPATGRYGVRSYGFWQSARGTMLTAKEVAIADVVATPSGRELQLRVCSQRAASLGVTLDLAKPDAHPVVRRILIGAAGGFRSDALPLAAGFDRAELPQCAGRAGQQVAKRASQTWISGSTCRCPGGPDEPPTRDDCRVTDGDGDGYPGLAYRQVGRGVTVHLATVQRTQYQRGRLEARGALFANHRIDEVAYPLACSSSSDCASLVAAQPCTSENNGTDFVPLPPSVGWNCATLLANEQQLFTRQIPSPPRTCTREVVGDAQ